MKTKWVVVGLGLTALFAVGLFGGYLVADYRAQAKLGVAFGARVACSCRHISGRTLTDCRKDFEPGMEPVTLTEDAAAKSVTAHYPLLASATARYQEGWGCRLDAAK